ncbi:MAG: PAS domain-containing protein, partial [Actinobacteria bacterium]|nr:PAS domain-containing protein [Actinomycetota bacterium]
MNIYTALIIANIVICFGICAVTIRRINFVGAKQLLFLIIALTIYSLGYLFEVLSPALENKIIWYNIEYFGIATIPFLWLVFAFKYTGFEWLLSKKWLFIFALIPVITIIMVWTNKYHGLMIEVLGISTAGALPEILKINGPWYWVQVSYSYLLIFSGSVILLKSVFSLPPFYIKRGAILILGSLIPFVGSALYIFKLAPVKSFDFIPLFLGVSGVLLTWSLFKIKVFQIVPIIRDMIFDYMKYGYLVTDNEGKIIDANKYAQRILDFNIRSLIGYDVVKFFSDRDLLNNLYTYNGAYPDRSINNGIGGFQKPVVRGPVFFTGGDKKSTGGERTSMWSRTFSFTEDDRELKIRYRDFINSFKGKSQVLIINPENKDLKKFISVSPVPIEKNGRNLSGFLFELQDITESKIIEERLYSSRKKIETINKIIYGISISENTLDVFTKISDTVKKLLGFEYTGFFQYNSRVLEKMFVSRPVIKKIFDNSFFYNEAFKHFKRGEFRFIDVSGAPENYRFLSEYIRGIRSILFIPVENIGLFIFFAAGSEKMDEENIDICGLLANQSVVVLKRIWLQKSLKAQAERDPLTGVYNRRY